MSESASAARSRAPRPTLGEFFAVARRPRWIAALVAALAIAAAFAALGQWQLERSIDNATIPETATETPVALTAIAEPQAPMTDPQIGQRVTAQGVLVPGDFVVLDGRENDGVVGAWLVGHVMTDEGTSLAVGLGWAPDADAAAAAVAGIDTDAPIAVAGRYLPSESPALNDLEAGEHRALSIGELINLWREPAPVYAGYVVQESAPSGLDDIHQPPPFRDTSLSWLNVFYAIEWAIFAAFAVYLWYRVVRDVWEREHELGDGQTL